MKASRMRVSHQINNYFCGPAVIVTALSAYGIKTTQKEAARRARTNKAVGTSIAGLVSALRSFGMHVRAGRQTLSNVRRAAQKGAAVIVCYTEPRSEEGHYAVVAGFKERAILILDPSERGQRPITIPISEFKKRWREPLYTHTERFAAFVQGPHKRNVTIKT